jgi:hypothetical protein
LETDIGYGHWKGAADCFALVVLDLKFFHRFVADIRPVWQADVSVLRVWATTSWDTFFKLHLTIPEISYF